MLWLLLLQVWASCLWQGHGEVVPSFANTCNSYFYQNMPATSGLVPQNPAWICQTFKNKTFYATLYDRNKRIPVYSAYMYEPGTGNRSNVWMVEPQLICQNLDRNMEKEQNLKKNCTEQEIEQSQAVNQDYNGTGFHRGHLNPNSQHNTQESKDATFTLTNAVPMNAKLNCGAWRSYEVYTMRNKSMNCKTTYVIVGAVPGNSYISNGRVNVPSHIWSGACCKTKNNNVTAWAAIAENNQNKVQNLTLGALEKKLANLYNRGRVSLFHSDCPRNISLTSWV